jgi:hypothetical protein
MAVPKARMRNLLFWDISKEFTIPQSVLTAIGSTAEAAYECILDYHRAKSINITFTDLPSLPRALLCSSNRMHFISMNFGSNEETK